MLRDTIIAAIRTGVAAAIGIAITWLLNFGVQVPDDFASSLNLVVFGLVTAGYNLAVGLLERKVHPLFGVLLGIPKAPAYGEVGTQTPPPNDPLLGNPATDRGAVEPLFGLGIALVLIGLLVWLLTLADLLGIIILIAGIVLVLVAATRGGGGYRRL
jgi:hypothetical protein